MKFEFEQPDNSYRYEFHFLKEFPGYIDVQVHTKGVRGGGAAAWLHPIKDGQIIWRQDGGYDLHLTPEAKEYISKIVKLLVFA
jgi:hypothetical protein